MARRLNLVSLALAVLSTACAGLGHAQTFALGLVAVASPLSEPRFTPLSLDQQRARRLEGDFLKVSISSRDNIAELAERRHLNVGVTARFCDSGEGRILMSPPELYYGDAQVNYNSVPKAERQHVQALIAKLPETEQKIYHFYIDIKSTETDEHLDARVLYDLASEPKDICVRIRGGGYLTQGFESNVMVISKAAIQAAFKEVETKR